MLKQKKQSLQPYNSFGLEVTANQLWHIHTKDDANAVARMLQKNKTEYLILGGGSNILFADDYQGVVVKIEIPDIEVVQETKHEITLLVGAGVDWPTFVDYCVENGYYGLENLSLIPGTVGASPIQNIGAYGVEVKDCLVRVTGVDLPKCAYRTYTNKDCQFGYRNSIFKNELKNKFLICHVTFKLKKEYTPRLDYQGITDELKAQSIENPTAADVAQAIKNLRRRKLPDPLEIGNAGSFFKNPVISNQQFENLKKQHPDLRGYPDTEGHTKISAAWLIEQAGLKGATHGNAGTSPDHALILINKGGATGTELIELALKIKNTVNNKFDIELQPEVNIIASQEPI